MTSKHPILAEYRRLIKTLRPRFEEFHERYAKHLTEEDIGMMLHKAARTFCDPLNEPDALHYSMHPTIVCSLRPTLKLGVSFDKDTLDVMFITLPERSATSVPRNSGDMPLILRIEGEPTMFLPGEEIVPHTNEKSADAVHGIRLPLTPGSDIIANTTNSPVTAFFGGRSAVIPPGGSLTLDDSASVVHGTAALPQDGQTILVNDSNYQTIEFVGGRFVVILPEICQTFPTYLGAADDEDTHTEWRRLNEGSDE